MPPLRKLSALRVVLSALPASISWPDAISNVLRAPCRRRRLYRVCSLCAQLICVLKMEHKCCQFQLQVALNIYTHCARAVPRGPTSSSHFLTKRRSRIVYAHDGIYIYIMGGAAKTRSRQLVLMLKSTCILSPSVASRAVGFCIWELGAHFRDRRCNAIKPLFV